MAVSRPILRVVTGGSPGGKRPAVKKKPLGWDGDGVGSPVMKSVNAYVRGRLNTRSIGVSTAVHQRQVLRTFAMLMGERKVEQIGRTDIERWMETMRKLAPGTVRNRYTIVRCWLDHEVDEGRLKRSPMRGIGTPKVPRSRHRALDREQVAAILDACPDALSLAYTLLGLQCGFRVAEVAGLELGDLNWTTHEATVTGKGGHVRTVHVPDEAWGAVQDYLRVEPCNGGPLFRLRRFPTHPVTASWIGEDFVKIAKQAGIKTHARDGVSYHALRHTAATDIFLACGSVVAVQQVLGHQSLENTRIYVRGLDRSGLAEAMGGRTYLGPVDEVALRRRQSGEPSRVRQAGASSA